MNALTNIEVLEECISQFKEARSSVVKAMPLLYQVWERELWSHKYTSLGEFLDECGISRSQASRLIAVYARFQGVPGLAKVDPERLYLALKLEGSAEEQFKKAEVLSRSEIKSQTIFEKTGDEHVHEPIQICKVCSVRM